MSKRTKSFFEQDQQPKHQYPNWKRSNTFNAPSRVETKSLRDVISGPPIAPSKRTKSKLKAFQFIEGAPTPDEDEEKENQYATPNKAQPSKIAEGDKPNEHNHMEMSPSAAPPSTPATRLPLALLVGNSDDRLRMGPVDDSPEDQIYWQHNASPRSSMVNAATPAQHRGKKRARSSSPATASQQEKSGFFRDQDSLKTNTIQPLLTTPQADPATDLWNKYSLNADGTVETPVSKTKAAFAHLINESSPRSSATAGSVSGLRRWASCGVAWPTSKRKRRRLAGTFRSSRDVAPAESGTEMADSKPAASKAERLLERIQETLADEKRRKTSALLSSSSPSANAYCNMEEDVESPLQHKRKSQRPPSQQRGVERSAPDSYSISSSAAVKAASSSSSDYGDDDLDLDVVEAMNEPSAQPPSKEPTIKTSELRTSQTLGACVVLSPKPAPQISGDDFSSDDEFGIGDDDLFDNDISNMAAACESESSRPVVAASGSATKVQVTTTLTQSPPRIPANEASVALVDASDDEFGGNDIDDDQFVAAVDIATQQGKVSGGTQASVGTASGILDPLLVVEVQENFYINERNHQFPQKIVRVNNERRKATTLISLRQSWFDSQCSVGMYVHVIGQCNNDGSYIIDDNQNLLIIHPDQLLTATAIAESSECVRRSVLNDRVKIAFSKNAGLVYGNILHELFQEAMKANCWNDQWLDKTAQEIIPRHLESILEINVTEFQVLDHIRSKAPSFQAWAQLFVQDKPGPESMVNGSNGQKFQISISKLLDVEENIFSPAYGIKGKIDATVQISTNDQGVEKTLAVPFELKTGRENASHRAQTALYTLLLSDRYDVDIAYGLLWNIEASSMSRVQAVRHLIRPLIMRRNELATWIRERSVLPPVLKEYQFCDTCKVRDPCFIYHTLAEGGDGTDFKPKAKEKFDEMVKYLKPSHGHFFSTWQALLSKEEADMMKFRKELWTLLSKERERLGRCFSSVIIEPGSFQELHEGSRMNRFRYTFVKQKHSSGFSFAESQLVKGEPVVVSDEQGHYYLAKGFVDGVHKRRITVRLDRALHNARKRKPGFDAQCNQVFGGIMELPGPGPSSVDSQQEGPLYRLDKDEFENGMGVPRNNLIQLMNRNAPGPDLKSLIVDQIPPKFKPAPTAYSLGSQAANLNRDQKAAIEKVMSAQDYALVLGMPGTGKTTTIAHIIRALVSGGKTVLLTSFQHSAVDNILLKIREDKIGILRLGAVTKIHPEVKEFAILAEEPKQSLEEVERAWTDPPIVASTCLKVDHPIFSRRQFDYCIVDEASQITLPVCLGPIRMARTFILVGDHFQLPPLVRNKEALAGGLDRSLFRILCEQHPEAMVNLEHQYRMNADIMTIANTLVYSGRLKCGSNSVASRMLPVPVASTALARHHIPISSLIASPSLACRSSISSRCHLARSLDPESRVLFLNSDRLGPTALEVSSSSTSATRITNPLEAILVTQISALLLSAGVAGSEIGIITPHRSQLSLLKTHVRNISHAGASQIELNTADKYQGRDKEVILVSFVRNNESRDVGELLRDARRVNVAVTRARSKLIMVGGRKTLEGDKLLKQLVGLCDEKNWMFDLQTGCIEGHSLEDLGTTQTTAAAGATQMSPGRPVPSKASQPLVFTDDGQLISPEMKKAGKSAAGRKALSPLKPTSVNARMGTVGYLSQRLSQGSQKGKLKMKKPAKGTMHGMLKGFLDKRPVLRDMMNDAA